MVRADEERRALLFRQQQVTRQRAIAVRNAALRGSNATVKAIKDGWEPYILARLEADYDERNSDE